MTPKQFQKRMTEICSSDRPELVLKPALDLITKELGAGMPAYLVGLSIFMDKIKAFGPALWTFKDDNVINLFDHKPRPRLK
jgi:hypothetical protein